MRHPDARQADGAALEELVQIVERIIDERRYRYLFGIDGIEGVRRAAVVGAVSQLLTALWDSNTPAVASCDFEDELPRHGGTRDE